MMGESNNSYNRYQAIMLLTDGIMDKHELVQKYPEIWALDDSGKLYQCHDGSYRMILEEESE